MKRIAYLAVAAGALSLGASRGAAAEGDWSFDVTPYLWVASVKAETSLPPATPGVQRFDSRISAGAMLAAQARYQSVGVLVDFAWLRLDTASVNPGPAFSAVELGSSFIHSTAALTYQLPLEGKFHVDLLAGARVWHVANDFQATAGLLPGFRASSDRTWIDPMIGLDSSYDLSDRWALDLKGMVGGFGVSADLAAEVFAGVSYRINDWCSATTGYRYLHEDYSHNGFGFNVDAQGFLVALGFHF